MKDEPILRDASLAQVAINVKDLARATTFYRDQLGFQLLFEAGPMTFFNCQGIRLMLSRAEKPEYDHPSSILYFHISGIQAFYTKLKNAGIEMIGEPHCVAPMPDHDLWLTFFKDSEGNTLALTSEEPKQG